MLVKRDLTSKLAIMTSLVLIFNSRNSLTNVYVSLIVKSLVEKGRRSGTRTSASL